jgi:ABC-type glycerol-3-phosphate transport system permease component
VTAVSTLLRWILTWGLALFVLLLLGWVVMTASKTNGEIFANPFGLPEVWSLDNVFQAWEVGGLGTAFLNSGIVALLSVTLGLLLASTVAYAISCIPFRGASILYLVFAVGLGVPLQALIVPTFLKMTDLGIRDSIWSLILVYAVFSLPKAVFLLAAFMTEVSAEIREAAAIDGAGHFRTFGQVVLPLVKPALATVGIIDFIGAWNEYIYASVLVSDPAARTLPLGLANFHSEYSSSYGLVAAGIVLSIVPVIVVYILFQRQVVEGLSSGALKG